MTASTLTRSQVGLSRISVADWSEPDEQPAINSKPTINARPRIFPLLLLAKASGKLPPPCALAQAPIAGAGINAGRFRSAPLVGFGDADRNRPASPNPTRGAEIAAMSDRHQSASTGAVRLGRRGLLKCMSWAGAGVVWSLGGGVPRMLGPLGTAAAQAASTELTFVQISDSHIGFHLPPNPDPAATLGEAIAKIKAMPQPPAFLVHTGDISHLSKAEQWDQAVEVIKGT